MNNSYNVSFFGALLETGNLGCRALTTSLIKLVIKNVPDANISLLYDIPVTKTRDVKIAEKTVRVNLVNSRLSPKAKLNENLVWILFMAILYKLVPLQSFKNYICSSIPSLKIIERSDFVGDIRGGDSFSDIYGLRRIIFGSIPAIVSILMNKRLVLLPQTYGPYTSWIARRIARFIFVHADRIYARDKQSIDEVRKLAGRKSTKIDVRFCPDVAFTLDSVMPDTLDIEPVLDSKRSRPLIGLNVSGLLYNGGYTKANMFGLKFDYKEFTNTLIEKFLEETEAHIVLIPHNFSKGVESDREACFQIKNAQSARSSDRVHVINCEYDQNTIKGVIGLCDFFIGARMHSCIASLSQEIPTIGIAYSKKFRGVFESIEQEENVVDARKLDKTDIVNICMDRFNERNTATKLLHEKIPAIKSEIESVFSAIINDI